MKFLSTFLLSGVMACSLGLTACSDNDDSNGDDDDSNALTAKELALQKAAVAYVDNTVLPTYSAMADAAIELYDLCEEIRDSHAAGNLTTDQIAKAGEAWRKSRKNWELSEAFLFGPASNHNIDPHIDSWPLDRAAMEDLLKDIRAGKSWNIDNNGGYGLLGFHSVEFLLFELSEDENTSLTHSTGYTSEELEYLMAVVDDLRAQCVCLEACWAGTDNISSLKQAILEEADLDYDEEYGWEMKNARQAGSRFKTYQAVAEEIIAGCASIADEVGNTKIGRPHTASNDEDKNYIESPYSLNSIEDFVDNIRSIENSYCGSRQGDASVSDYVKSVNPALDTKLRNTIAASIAAIQAISEPFTKTATGSEAAKAVEVTGEDLVNVLDEVRAEILKH